MLSKEWQELKKQEVEVARKLKAQMKRERNAALPMIRKQCRELGITAAMLKGALKPGRTTSGKGKWPPSPAKKP
jgi:hypothetical protein